MTKRSGPVSNAAGGFRLSGESGGRGLPTDASPAGVLFQPRVVGTVVVTLLVINIVWSMVEAWLPPSPKEFSAQSHSARAPGYRGLFDLVTTMGVPVSRSHGAPSDVFQGERRILMLEPDIEKVETEKAYQALIGDWVRGGGQLVVVSRTFEYLGAEVEADEKEKDERAHPKIPVEDDYDGPIERRQKSRTDRLIDILGPDSFLENLGIAAVSVEPWASSRHPSDEPGDFMEVVEEAWGGLPAPKRYVEPTFSGTLYPWTLDVTRLRLPDFDLSWFAGPGIDDAVGRVDILGDNREALPIVLAFQVGAGEVILVSEPVVLNNIGLATARGPRYLQSDNAVLAYRLAVGDGSREVVFDEFYHGALHNLGPLALMALHPYRAVALSILFATILWAWAYGVRFGPPLAVPPENRRNILEYVDAMARLFARGGKQRFVLQTNRQGLLDEVRGALLMPLGTPEHLVIRRLAQFDPEAAKRLEAMLSVVDGLLRSTQVLSPKQLRELQIRLETCRIPETQHRWHPTLLQPNRLPPSTAGPSTR